MNVMTRFKQLDATRILVFYGLNVCRPRAVGDPSLRQSESIV